MRWRLALFLPGFGVIGCAEAPPPQAPSAPSAGPVVPLAQRPVHVFFEGTKGVRAEELERAILVDKKSEENVGLTNGQILDRDILKINNAYFDHGYLDVKIGSVEIEGAGDGQFVDVRFPIDEGKLYRLGTVTLEEHDEVGKIIEPIGAPLRPRVSLQDGAVIDRAALIRDLEKIRTLYRDQGYWSVSADPETELLPEKALMNVKVSIKRNALTTIDRVLIHGNRHVPNDKIVAALQVKDGDLFNETKILETKARLLALGFKSVDIAVLGVPSITRSTLIFEAHEQ